MQPTTQSHRTPSAPRRSPWPFAIAGLLLAHVGAMMLAVYIAGNGDGNRLLPEYRLRNEAPVTPAVEGERPASKSAPMDAKPG